ncbi:Histidine triad (HIT) protein OS=Tsukamurella paurometabola (strain ATCC 8368 / DSM / CCUG 35730/ CIP 100753 / JCM 10117 / KCTC 9821 / NBRC 16120 / NCIMB 702349 / NCTC 13040) OX=521096 GN=Tpau_1318 PE=4 SV=1 [Tsukamurella paurometabola]|uniref:Histidine triad (HIT) protein n=1 Tax=Tsukamurella paurometabola (strain ATCC 8368 / DSM 20162 / CCUG 35730 / CIP 100753 / JCM 10117 / KCTC 9821 / NBRC 16120 / NCIMB 702349 / NCTC 13040) TaxID=521096 RepID=D5UWS5_TSUPD|nr:HIT domain-containing protein [Tsukamurella paurometabola]ADG77947.1 histidine triad (HIT) protein [Tsukamurella paurometabola DSM 20162]
MEQYTGNDFYCDIAIPRRQPVEVVHEDEHVLAFEHTRPHWPEHIVVVPKTHIASLLELTDGDLTLKLLAVVRQISDELLRRTGAAAVTTNLGAYQDSKHLHFHIHSGRALR